MNRFQITLEQVSEGDLNFINTSEIVKLQTAGLEEDHQVEESEHVVIFNPITNLKTIIKASKL